MIGEFPNCGAAVSAAAGRRDASTTICFYPSSKLARAAFVDGSRLNEVSLLPLVLASTAQASARAVLQRIRFPFANGLANAGLVDRLQIVNNSLFDLHEPLSVPMSVVLDSKRRVACLYKGPVSIDRLLADRQQLATSADEWRLARANRRKHNIPRSVQQAISLAR